MAHTPGARGSASVPSRRGPQAATANELAILGLHPGEAVRWRRESGTRWHAGTVARRERDGSVGVIDAQGAARSFPVDRLHVSCSGPRGGRAWEPLTARASRSEQLCLLEGWASST